MTGLLARDEATVLADVAGAVAEALDGLPLVPTRVERPHDPVTDLDLVVDRRLQRLLPTIVAADYLSEESPLGGGSAARLVWVVDPIDGTHNLVAGGSEFGVSVALVERSTMSAVLACCHYPVSGTTYTAARQQGASVDGERIGGPGPSALLMGYGVPQEAYADVDRVGALVAGLMRQGFVLRQSGSAMHDVCRVAVGQLHGFVEEGVRLWDVVAADLVATEAGATSWLAPSRWASAAEGSYDYVVAWSDDLTGLAAVVRGQHV